MSMSESLSSSELLPEDEELSLVDEELCFIFLVGMPWPWPKAVKEGTGEGAMGVGEGVTGVGACTVKDGMGCGTLRTAAVEDVAAAGTGAAAAASNFRLFGAWLGDLVADFPFFGALCVLWRVGVWRSEGCGVEEGVVLVVVAAACPLTGGACFCCCWAGIGETE